MILVLHGRSPSFAELVALKEPTSVVITPWLGHDRLHHGRTVRVSADGIVCTVSAWLAELGAHSPLVEDLARTVRDGNWTAAYAIADLLSVDVAVAA